MDSTLLSGVISGSIGIAGLAIGYLLREYQNRVKNFVHIYRIGSDMTKYHDDVDVGEELRKICEDSQLLDDLKKVDKYKNIYDNWDIADDLKRFWPKIKDTIDIIEETTNEETFLNTLQELFDNNYFEKYIRKFYLRGKADDIRTNLQEVKIRVSDADSDGDVFLSFPEKLISFNITKHPVGIAKFNLFLDNISKVDTTNIIEILKRFKSFMDQEYNHAIASIDSLLEIKNHQSRWAFYLQIANISPAPFILELEPVVIIKHKKNIYTVSLYTTIVDLDSNSGEETIKDISKPILFNKGEAKELVLISNEIEKNIEFGKTIREIFESEEGTYRIKWKIIKPGFLKRTTIRTPYSSFKE